MPRVILTLDSRTTEALIARAQAERRQPRDQAVVLIEAGLRSTPAGPQPPEMVPAREVVP